jgi:hypothetical protein
MDVQPSQPPSPHDPTMEMPAPALRAGLPSHEPQLCGRFGLLDSSGANLSAQTRSLLRRRLRAAAAMFFAAFVIFLIWGWLVPGSRESELPALFRPHLIAVIVLGAICALLFQPRPLPQAVLGACELVIFGLPALFLLRANQEVLLLSASRGYSSNPLVPWLCIIMLYGMFIPNTWRRAAVVVGAFAAAPLVLLVVLQHTSAQVAAVVSADRLGEYALTMCLAAGAATLGTHMIGSLRRQVFEARQLGQYRLIRRLGTGGMGEVYLAEHQLLKRPCALKIIRAACAGNPQAVARFEREVQATATLTHPNTVEIYDFGHTDDGTFYYVMEYLPGLTLAELVERHGPLPPERVVYLLRQACDALREAHSAGLIHRDIKPANIFVAERGGVYDVVKLLDFGLVKEVAQSQSAQITQEGVVAGSPLFMSPEQAMGQQPDARGDIYSLGAVAYFLLTGRPPFDGDSSMRIIVAHARDPVVPPSQLHSDVPAEIEHIVLRCLEKSPDDRYQCAVALEEAMFNCPLSGRWTARHAAAWWQEHESELAGKRDCG